MQTNIENTEKLNQSIEQSRLSKIEFVGIVLKNIIERIDLDVKKHFEATNEYKSFFTYKRNTENYNILQKLGLILFDNDRIYLTDKMNLIIAKHDKTKKFNCAVLVKNLIDNSLNKELFIKYLDSSKL